MRRLDVVESHRRRKLCRQSNGVCALNGMSVGAGVVTLHKKTHHVVPDIQLAVAYSFESLTNCTRSRVKDVGHLLFGTDAWTELCYFGRKETQKTRWGEHFPVKERALLNGAKGSVPSKTDPELKGTRAQRLPIKSLAPNQP